MDETKMKREGKQVYLWTAVDVDSKEILAIYISDKRCSLDTYWFLKKALKSCTNKPVIIGDKASWYHWARSKIFLENSIFWLEHGLIFL